MTAVPRLSPRRWPWDQPRQEPDPDQLTQQQAREDLLRPAHLDHPEE